MFASSWYVAKITALRGFAKKFHKIPSKLARFRATEQVCAKIKCYLCQS